MQANMAIEGEHLKTFKNIETLEECINICHMTRNGSKIDIDEIISYFSLIFNLKITIETTQIDTAWVTSTIQKTIPIFGTRRYAT